MQTQPPIKHALISVSNKKGIVEFASQLVQWNIEILASGGTAKFLKEHAIPVTPIEDYTAFPEIMGGRVKTLHPKIYAGLLARRGIDDDLLAQQQIKTIDLLIVNLYPFEDTIAKSNCSFEEAVEQIDIGGPTLLRAAAKNHLFVTVATDPVDYATILHEMQQQKTTSLKLRQQLAQKVFAHTTHYDSIIENYFKKTINVDEALFPEHYQPKFQLQEILRYGENPHQQAAYYKDSKTSLGTLADAILLQGKTLSYNNMIDADCALRMIQDFDVKRPSCVIVKHATPCGIALGDTTEDAYQKAYQCDPESAFGGIIAINQTLDAKLAQKIIQQQFVEVLLAPMITPDAKRILAKRPNLRLLQFATSPHLPSSSTTLALHSISGGLLVQENDYRVMDRHELQVVTQRQPTDAEWRDLLFAWQTVKYVKSNAIVFAKNEMTLGIGGGQTSRVFAAKIAVLRAELAELSLTGAAMASDAFFPFADSVLFAQKHGISSIIQPGGSKNDKDVIAAADAANITMIFTGIRHFRH